VQKSVKGIRRTIARNARKLVANVPTSAEGWQDKKTDVAIGDKNTRACKKVLDCRHSKAGFLYPL
jgi:hypothetical protein